MLQEVTKREFSADEAIEIFEASIAYYHPADAEAEAEKSATEAVFDEYYTAA